MNIEVAANKISISGYAIERELGQGGIATVYLAVQESLRRQVALKVMAPALTTHPNFTSRFLREGRIIAQLNHPGIVTIYDISVAGYHHYIAMEYLQGESLKQRLKDRLSAEETLEILYQVASALEFAHSAGVIHRDVKPENIMFRDKEGTEAVLTDFGIAKSGELQSQFTSVGMVVGTPRYMSPEQAEGHGANPQSDIYALGIVFFEMLTGLPPYGAEESMAILYAHINDPIPKLPEHYRGLQPLFEKMVAKEPQDRFADCSSLMESVSELLDQSHGDFSVSDSQKSILKSPQPETRSVGRRLSAAGRNILWAGVGLASILVISTVIWGLLQPEKGAVEDFALEEGQAPVIVTPKKLDLTEEDVSTEADLPEDAEQPGNVGDIQALLELAESQLQNNRLRFPEDNNAFDTYTAILKIQPDNFQAEQGMQRIADRYAELAMEQLEEKDFLRAEALTQNGLATWPEHAGLKELHEEVRNQAAEAGDLLKEEAESTVGISREAAESGNSELQFQLALALANGDGVERDVVEALKRLEEAAGDSHPGAQYNLALGLLFGPSPDLEAAGKWMKAAAKQSYKPAYRVLGWMYTTGTGQKTNPKEAVLWSAKGTTFGKPRIPSDVVLAWQELFEKSFQDSVVDVREEKMSESQGLK